MTSEQKQQRIEAAARALRTRDAYRGQFTVGESESLVWVILDAADRAVPVVGRDEAAEHRTQLEDEIRQLERLSDELVDSERARVAAEAAARDFVDGLERVREWLGSGECPNGCDGCRADAEQAADAARQALLAHPEFSEGTSE